MNTWERKNVSHYVRRDGFAVGQTDGGWAAHDGARLLVTKQNKVRYWKTVEAACKAVDKEFPCLPPKPRFPAIARRHMAALKLSAPAWIMGQHG